MQRHTGQFQQIGLLISGGDEKHCVLALSKTEIIKVTAMPDRRIILKTLAAAGIGNPSPSTVPLQALLQDKTGTGPRIAAASILDRRH